MNHDELKQRITERARQLWEEDGCPEGRDMEYWLKAEEELAPHSIAGEEDPLEALDHDAAEVSGKGKAP
ncbi:MAG: hypothetical protein K0R44_1040 [Thermomicrobiales bacterium]|jgi:hypothetical protein|nr:hypothetical protein [Thermomicrobiales bacterium]